MRDPTALMSQPPRYQLSPLTASIFPAVVVLILLVSSSAAGDHALAQAEPGFSPVSGHAQVIAQGVVELPRGQAVWRTVRARAALPAEARIAEQPLGFV